jgi:hypothetical protein
VERALDQSGLLAQSLRSSRRHVVCVKHYGKGKVLEQNKVKTLDARYEKTTECIVHMNNIYNNTG